MIRKLKIKLIALAMAALFALMVFMLSGMNLINYSTIISAAARILDPLSENYYAFQNSDDKSDSSHDPMHIVPEESRFFSVTVDSNGNITGTDTGRMASVDSETAKEYAKEFLSRRSSRGFINEYRYLISDEDDQTRIIFLNCERKLDAFRSFLKISALMSLTGLIIIFIIMFVLSGKIVRPIAESYEKQKRFITDAGHEIKTPLTIISANAELLEMQTGECEEITEIENQTRRLRSLTDDLVMLARMEESENTLQKIDFPLSDTVSEVVQSFRSVAVKQDKELTYDIQPVLTLNGNEKTVRQLVNILMDNAMKYSSEGGKIHVDLQKHARNIELTVRNTSTDKLDNEKLRHVFERFYRTDESRNSQTGGHGIGLSLAQAIVTSHGGKISARTDDGESFIVSVTFPA